ncbi:PfkB family carbohydrate kinase [Naasia sp. SYSU D00948]|uniref:PfkB family carbohydrate kinase n=1 Tax=Naasia sp. SYSU D00948 TaxID=2817379 RepID=UPI001B30C5F3|nr:PfkB family carbohydrate kinase [Naasia sp. SYSU D00948]
MAGTRSRTVLVVGQAARDLALRIEELPESGGSTDVRERLEMLGGKGANQAVGLRQLGSRVALLAVFGEDAVGERMRDEAIASGIDVSPAVRRGATALLVDVVEAAGHRRLLEDVPRSSLLTAADVRGASAAFGQADTVCLQLQQPAEALLAAADLARENGARVVLDGGIDGDARDRLLELADVVRADAPEAAALAGMEVQDQDDARSAAQHLLAAGPSVVALAVPGQGDLVAWAGGGRFFPYGEESVVDPTGAGDAFLAGLVTGLREGLEPEAAGRRASAAASATVARLGGRPDLAFLAAEPS